MVCHGNISDKPALYLCSESHYSTLPSIMFHFFFFYYVFLLCTWHYFLLCLHSRRYLPILKGFPAKYIYDPWNAPEEVQKKAKCIIGVHYPKPMVNHAEASRVNIERMKQIYQQLSCYKGLGRDMTQLHKWLFMPLFGIELYLYCIFIYIFIWHKNFL